MSFAQSLSYEELDKAQRLLDETVWGDLSIEFRQVKKEVTPGFQVKKLAHTSEELAERVFYVSGQVIIDESDIWGMDVNYNPYFERTLSLVVYLKDEGVEKLRSYSTEHTGELLGILIDGQLVNTPKIIKIIEEKEISIFGPFSPALAMDVVRRFYEPLKLKTENQEETIKAQ